MCLERTETHHRVSNASALVTYVHTYMHTCIYTYCDAPPAHAQAHIHTCIHAYTFYNIKSLYADFSECASSARRHILKRQRPSVFTIWRDYMQTFQNVPRAHGDTFWKVSAQVHLLCKGIRASTFQNVCRELGAQRFNLRAKVRLNFLVCLHLGLESA